MQWLIAKVSSGAVSSFECGLEGTAQPLGNGAWQYIDQEDPEKCQVTLKIEVKNAIRVSSSDCRKYCGMGAGFENGVFSLSRCSGFHEAQARVGDLSKARKFSQALKLGLETEKNCTKEISDLDLGSLQSDIAFLYFKTGNKNKCLERVNAGLKAADLASESVKSLEKNIKVNGGEKDAEIGWVCGIPYCSFHLNQLTVFKQLMHNRGLCKKR
jgi:hypothetical protein